MIKSIMLFLMILNLTSCNIPLRNLEASPVDNIENLRNINLAFRMERSPYIETSIGKGQIYFFRASEASIYAPNDKTSLLLNHINETLLESATSWVTDFVDPRNFSMPILIYQSSRKNSKGSSLQI
ncbi:MAG: hypothetical protein FWE02_00565 [Defluviitaleaceae bacterium]|nr:hypothetical protein [Defluviitaleaceae bacterium]